MSSPAPTLDPNYFLVRGSRGPLVGVLQTYLNITLRPKPALKPDCDFGHGTEIAVRKLQFMSNVLTTPSFTVVGIGTWAALAQRIGPAAIVLDKNIPPDLKNFMLTAKPFTPGASMFDRKIFFGLYPVRFKSSLGADQRPGLDTLLGYLEKDKDLTDIRWIAYMLTTVKKECTSIHDSWVPMYKPISEDYCDDSKTPVCTPISGNQRSYGDRVPCPNLAETPPRPCPNGKKFHTYYGRGYVQLTGQDTYQNVSDNGCAGDLMHNPEAALVADTAYKIMSAGMRLGLYVHGQTLAAHIDSKHCDYKNARRIINPGDHASYEPMAEDARAFQDCLVASVR